MIIFPASRGVNKKLASRKTDASIEESLCNSLSVHNVVSLRY
jgi:hypothetical protein